MASKQAIKSGEGYVELGVRDSGMIAGLGRAESRFKAFGARIGAVGAGIMAAAATASIPLYAGLGAFGSYEQALADLRAATGVTGETFAALRKSIESVASSTGTTLEDTTNAFSELVKAGISLESVLDGVGIATIKFSRIARMETSQTAVVLANAMMNFRREGLSASEVVNIISRAADSSTMDVRNVAAGFTNAGSTMGLFNQSMRDTAAAIAMLAPVAASGEDAGTQLRTIFLRLAGSAEEGGDAADRAIRRLGLSIYDARGQFRPLIDIVRQIETATRGMTQQQRDAALQELGGARGIRGLARLYEVGAEGMAQFQRDMESTLTVEEKFSIGMNTLVGKMKMLFVQVQLVAVAIGEALAPTMRVVYDVGAPLLALLAQLISNSQDYVRGLDAMVTVTMAVGAAMVAFGIATYGAGIAISILTPALLFAKTGFGLLTVAVFVYNTAMVVANALTWGLKAALIGLAVIVGGVFAVIASGIAIAIGYLGYLAVRAVVMSDVFQGVLSGIAAAFSSLWSMVQPILAGIGSGLQTFFGPLLSEIGSIASQAAVSFGNAWSQSVAQLSQTFTALVEVARTAFGAIQDAMATGDWGMVWEIVKVTAEIAWAEISFAAVSIFNSWADAIGDVFGNIWTSLKVGFTYVWAAIKSIWFTTLAGIASGMTPIFNMVSGLLAGLASVDPTGAAARAREAFLSTFTNPAVIAAQFERQANDAIEQGANDALAVRGEAAFANAEADVLRILRDAERAAGHMEEVARLQGELDFLAAEAETNRLAAGAAAGAAVAGGPPLGQQGGAELARASLILGGFGAAGTFGRLGSSQTTNPVVNRLERLENNLVRVLEENQRVLEGIQRVAGARVG